STSYSISENERTGTKVNPPAGDFACGSISTWAAAGAAPEEKDKKEHATNAAVIATERETEHFEPE
ncbi:MAG: hypothetical protein KDD69_00785, partial [Bdellovibrionales bacterium]|nr:hypothetical protein [Bdellovibrionales bacterium]